MSAGAWTTDDPWEHVRLLSDPDRNQALLGFLARNAPGRSVLEVGCGTGVLSAAAARMGAREVLAVEATSIAGVARQVMADNGLDQVTVIESRIEHLEPRPMDLVFSELLNVDPFAEGVVEVSWHAAKWVAPGGLLAPGSLEVWAAACRSEPTEIEARHAALEVAEVERAWGLDLGRVHRTFREAGPFRTQTVRDLPAGEPVCVLNLALGTVPAPPERFRFRLQVGSPRACGVLIWFEAPLGDGFVLHNRPGTDNHWGQQVHVFPEPLQDGVELEGRVQDGQLTLRRVHRSPDGAAESG